MDEFGKIKFENLDELNQNINRLPAARAEILPPEVLKMYANASKFHIIQNTEEPFRIHNIVSERYDVVQHADVAKSIVSTFGELGLEEYSGEINWLRYGARLSVKMYQKKPSEVTMPNGREEIRHGIMFWNSYDRSTSVGAGYAGVRIFCTNQMTARRLELRSSKRHVGIEVIAEFMKKAINHIREFQPEFEKMIVEAASSRVEDDIQAVLERLGIGPRAGNKIVEKPTLKGKQMYTVYDLYNALTDYASHEIADKPNLSQSYLNLADEILTTPQILVKAT